MQLTRRRFLRGSLAAGALPFLPACAGALAGEPAKPPSHAEPGDCGIDPLYGYQPGDARLNKNENPFGPSPRALEAIVRHVGQSHRYVDASQVRRAIAGVHGVEPEMVITGTGSGEILGLIPFAFMLDGGNMVSTRQTYRATPDAAELLGRQVRWVDLRDDWSYDVDGMLASVDAETRILYVVNPNNPTGTVASHADLDRMAGSLPGGAIMVLDEAYVHFLPEGAKTGMDLLAAGRHNVLVTRTFSKAFGLAGLRVGYAVGHPDVVGRISELKMTGMNVAAFAGALAALGDEEHVRRFVDHAATCRTFYERELSGLGLEVVSGRAPLVMAGIGDRAPEVVDRLAGRGIHVRKGHGWDMPGHVRISFGLEEENRRVIAALAEIMGQPAG